MSGFIIQSEKNKNFYKMPDGYGHYFARLSVGRLWGQISLIMFLNRLSVKWALMEPTRPFGMGDLASEDGKKMEDHQSHFSGVGVDIYIIHKDGLQRNDRQNMISWADKKYDQERTLKLAKLIAELRKSFPMIQLLYNDPLVIKEVPGIVYHKNHDDHFHILLTGKHPYTEDQIAANLKIAYTIE